MRKPSYWKIILETNFLTVLHCLKTSANLLDVMRVKIGGIMKEFSYLLTVRLALWPSFIYLWYGTYLPAQTTESSPLQVTFVTANTDRLMSAVRVECLDLLFVHQRNSERV